MLMVLACRISRSPDATNAPFLRSCSTEVVKRSSNMRFPMPDSLKISGRTIFTSWLLPFTEINPRISLSS
ncbi:hypothetical protein D3C85_1916270 [compost metagenome]